MLKTCFLQCMNVGKPICRDSLRLIPHRNLCPFQQSHAMHMLMRRRTEHPLILAAEL